MTAGIRKPILIVGAGPTGLTAAVELSRRSIPLRIIDKNAAFSNLSRAIVVHARTLEALDQIGIAQTLVDAGQKVQTVRILKEGRRAARAFLGDMGKGMSPFPFFLGVAQDQTERILHEKASASGVRVEWKTELSDLQEKDDHVEVTLMTGGVEEKASFSYVIGADGAHSAVRHALGIEFEGAPYEQEFYLADCRVSWPENQQEARESVSLCLSRDSFAAVIPLAGEGRFRVLGILPMELRGREITLGDIEGILGANRLPVKLEDGRWTATYRLHHRCARSFGKGRVFICGDAAHIHSPAGGQGMNTGIQDAYNLCWKLALVFSDAAHPRLLETYQAERLPFARWLVKSTDRLFSGMTGRSFFSRFLRMRIVPLLAPFLLSLTFVRRTAFLRGSQIHIQYDSGLLVEKGRSSRTIQPGRRLPYFTLNGRNGFELLRAQSFTLLLFGNAAEKEELLRRALPLSGQCAVEFVPLAEIESEHVFHKGAILLRPDQYTALAMDDFSAGVILDYFQELKRL